MLILLGYMLAYIYFAINFVMVAMEHRVAMRFSNASESLKRLSNMLSKEHNSSGYLLARFYFYGTLVLNFGGIYVLKQISA